MQAFYPRSYKQATPLQQATDRSGSLLGGRTLCHGSGIAEVGVQRRRHAKRHVATVQAVLTQRSGTASLARPRRGGSKERQAKETVLEAISNVKGRGKSGLTEEQMEQFNAAVEVLEAGGGVQAPVAQEELLEGRWKLLFTTQPGTASPIQRTFVGVDAFKVFQEILFKGQSARVNNIVDFGAKIGELRVEAEASTDSRPLPGFTPRRGKGLAVFGKSFTYPPKGPDTRIDFQFDKAGFYFKALPFVIPYPVPFKYLGDETKGWLDITYLAPDGSFRLSRGNKGTLFVLMRDVSPADSLITAVASGAPQEQVLTLIDEASQSGRSIARPAFSNVIQGKWRLRWSMQAGSANPLQKAFASQSYQIVGDDAGKGRLENLVEFAPFLKLRAGAACSPSRPDRTSVDIDFVRLELGPLRVPVPIKANGGGYVDWLYVDDNVRVSRGNKGSLFIHTRV